MKKLDVKKLVLLAMLSAIAYILVMLVRIPVFEFLSYEPKDVAIVIGGFLLGPGAAAVSSVLVSLLEMVTFSQTGPIGCLMNILSTCSFACVASLIYKKKHTLGGAVVGLAVGTAAMTGIMLLWNWLITPLYMGIPRAGVVPMLLPVFLPFNAIKAGLNSALTLALYKPLVVALQKARLLPATPQGKGSPKIWVYILAAVLLITCILLLLVFQGKI